MINSLSILLHKIFAILFVIFLLSNDCISQCNELPVSTNTPNVITTNIIPGMETVEIPFEISGSYGLVIELIVPIDGVSFSLLDPAGNIVLSPGSSDSIFSPGYELNPDKKPPGGVFLTNEIVEPTNGIWKIKLDFPRSTYKTVVMSTIIQHTSYDAGIVSVKDTFSTGENTSLGILLLNDGVPIVGLAPTIQVNKKNSNEKGAILNAVDNGITPDGLSRDGVYSIDYTFEESGEYLINGIVKIPTKNGEIKREVSKTVKVINPPASITNFSIQPITSDSGCISQLVEKIELNVNIPGEYVVNGAITKDGSAYFNGSSRAELAIGNNSLILNYSSKDLLENLNPNNEYSFKTNVIYFGEENYTSINPNQDLNLTQKLPDNICKEPIIIGTDLVVDKEINNGYFQSLIFKFPVTVQTPGYYQISTNVVGVNGDKVDLIGFTQYLSTGSNIVNFTIPSEMFQSIDGPYSVISTLVKGASGTAQLSKIGESPLFTRWQFAPLRNGDLDNDGDVDDNDQKIILSYRNQTALSPGDRRDILRDGIIDLRDARAILKLK